MNGLDLFSGIGGLTKALEPWVTPIAYCEIDRYAVGVLLSRMAQGDLPVAPIWDDVKTLTRINITPPVDIIYGGFPCQDLSFAGRGAGLDGERSGLFFEIIRLVCELRPRFVFLENVSAITVRGAERVVGELCKLRYDSRWGILSAADVGANHRRERWWLLAHSISARWSKGSVDGRRNLIKRREIQEKRFTDSSHIGQTSKDVSNTAGNRMESQQLPRKIGWQKQSHFDGKSTETLSNTDISRLQECGQQWFASGQPAQAFQWSTEPPICGVANGVPMRVDKLKCLGNAVVPAQAREAFERLMGLK